MVTIEQIGSLRIDDDREDLTLKHKFAFIFDITELFPAKIRCNTITRNISLSV